MIRERSIPKNTSLRAVWAVLSGFSGIRQSQGLTGDLNSLRLQHVIIAGVLCATLFVSGLVALVNLVVN